MRRAFTVLLMLGLTSAQSRAEELLGDSLSRMVSGVAAQRQQDRLRRQACRLRRDELTKGLAIPDGGRSFVATASYYGGGPRAFEPNTHTASGEKFDQWGMTAAHRTLPLGTRLLVSHGDRSVVVRVNDRGPATWTGRSLDVSRGAATRLGLIGPGHDQVRVQVLGRN